MRSSDCRPQISDSGSRAIAVVDAHENPNAAGDLAAFNAQFGVAFEADPHTGVWIYDRYPIGGRSGTWRVVVGTGIPAPSLAGIGHSAGSFHGCVAAPGWDSCSGVGSVNGDQEK